jgi:Integrase core domain
VPTEHLKLVAKDDDFQVLGVLIAPHEPSEDSPEDQGHKRPHHGGPPAPEMLSDPPGSTARNADLQVRVTRHPTADWTAQQVVDTCGWDRDPPRYLIRDRDSRYGEAFDRRLRGLGVRQLRTPPKAPRANALAERWVRSARTECLDHLCIVDERHLQRALDEYVAYFNAWRPHRGLGQRAPCGSAPTGPSNPTGRIIGRPVLGGLHHVYQHAA